MRKGWEIKKIGEVCTVIAGQSPEGKYYNKKGNGLPFYQGKKEFTEKYIGKPTTWTSVTTKEAVKGDILMSVRAPVGPVNFSTHTICIGRGLAAIRAGELIDKDFLFHFLVKYENEIVGKAGAVFNSINKSEIENIHLSVPPLAEQKRIVAVLEETFAALEKVKANVERNLQNAKDLFENYLQNVFTKLSEVCEEKTLYELCDIIGGGTPSKANSKFYNGDIPWATVRDMKFDNLFETEHKITKEAVRKSSTNIIPGGNIVIASRVGLGKVCLLKFDTAINQDLKGIIPKASSQLLIDYLFYWFKSISRVIIKEGTGATVQGVKLSFINSLVIPLPSRKEQEKVIVKLKSIESKTHELVAIYQKKIRDLEELRKSILRKAFTGELTYSSEKITA